MLVGSCHHQRINTFYKTRCIDDTVGGYCEVIEFFGGQWLNDLKPHGRVFYFVQGIDRIDENVRRFGLYPVLQLFKSISCVFVERPLNIVKMSPYQQTEIFYGVIFYVINVTDGHFPLHDIIEEREVPATTVA